MNPTEIYAETKNVSGAISSPNRYSSGTATKMAAKTRLSRPTHQTEPPSANWKMPNRALIAAEIDAAILRTRKRLETLSA